MRSSAAAAVVAIVALVLAAPAIPVFGQEAETPAPSASPTTSSFERPSVAVPVAGEARGDGTIVLPNDDYCSYLVGEIWGTDKLTFRDLIDRTKKQKKAKKAAFQPFADEATLQRCAAILDAFRQEAPAEDTLPPWAREAPVVPEAIVALLADDLLADPLAEPVDIGDGARTRGFGDAATSPFILWGGAYFVELDAPACESWSGSIRSASDPTVEAAVVDDTTYLYGVPTGNYFWDITAPGCDWSVDLIVFELPPDPTPTPIPKAVVPFLVPGGDNSVHLSTAAAAEALIEAGLTVDICQVVRDPFVDEGRVVFQDPPGGTLVEPGSSIRVHIDFPATCDSLPLTADAQRL